MARPVDWLLLGRYALLVALCALIPIPWLDRRVENLLRRRLVRALAAAHEVQLLPEDVTVLADTPGGGCTGCLLSVVLWPFKKLLKTVFFFLQAKTMADVASDVIHRGLLVSEALEAGWLPGDAGAVRGGMDRAMDKIDTRIVERAIRGVFRDNKHELNRVVHEATRIARARRDQEATTEALAEAADRHAISGADRISGAMTAALQATGVVPELLHWFRAEMGEVPRIPERMDGAVAPAEVLPPDTASPAPALPAPPIEDAEEVEE